LIIAAISDVHSPRHFEDFVKAVDQLDALTEKPDLFLIAGDMIHRGDIDEYKKVSNVFFGKVDCPIVACFGNNEYTEQREKLKQSVKNVRFLDDQSMILEFPMKEWDRNMSVGIIGTTGSLETPTKWQQSHIPNIQRIYQHRVDLVDRHLTRMKTDFRILLMHYSPTYETLEGENPRFYSSMGWNIYENVLEKRKPDLVIHGHSHRGKRMAWVSTVPVFNAALAVNNKILVIDTDTIKPGLTRFVG